MTPQERIDEINTTLEAIRSGWPFFMAALDERIADHTADLINQNNDETRGRIKALRALKEWPEALESERISLSEALAE